MIMSPSLRPSSPSPSDTARADAPHDALLTDLIAWMCHRWDTPPTLAELGERAGLSPEHLQRAFKRRVGISPKRFAQHLTLTRAKDLLRRRSSLLETALETGLSGPSRLHDLFINCEAMTPGDYKARGRDLVLRWGVHDSPIGPCLVATSDRGICWLSFGEPRDGLSEFESDWSAAMRVEDPAATAPLVRRIFSRVDLNNAPLPVLLRGTNFQMQVWRALLRIQPGSVATYSDVARAIDPAGAAGAVRAVGAACGANRVSYLIPCHRVINANGALTGYRWGEDRKRALLALEQPAEPDEEPRASRPSPR